MDKNAEHTNRVTESKSYVKIKYSVRVADGPFLKGAGEPEVMEFVTGYGQIIPGLEKRLLGHGPGAKLSFVIPPHECFGARHEELVIEKSRQDFHFPAGFEPFPGMEIPLVCSTDSGPETVRITEIRNDTIVIDLNHPLAGLSLKYNLEIIEARPATSMDVCAEWEEKKIESDCGCAPCQIVLGSPEIQKD